MFLQNVLGILDERAASSRIERWGCPQRPASDDRFAHFVWLAGFTMSAYDEVADAHPEFEVVDHEELSADPIPQFRRLVAALRLEWSDACEEYLRASNTQGSGFETRRVAGAQSGKWRARLSEDQQRVAREILSGFPFGRRYPDLRP
jgi:hypothetical protein